MTLPLMTLPEDIEAVLKYFKTKATGEELQKAKAVLGSKVLDARKLHTYEKLGLLEKEGARYRLTPPGRELAKFIGKAEFEQSLRSRLLTIDAYRAVLEYAYHQNVDELSSEDIGAFWHEHHRAETGDAGEKVLRERVACFGRLCHGAGLGQFVIGRKGHPSRLKLQRDVLESVVADELAAAPVSETPESPEPGVALATEEQHAAKMVSQPGVPAKGKGIFIGHGKNKKALEELKKILDQFDVPYKVAEEEPHLGRPISEKVKETMDQCDAAVLIFTADEELRDLKEEPVWRPSENVIHELGAAGYRYGTRIMILKDERVKMASNYSDLGYISFEEGNLSSKATDVLQELIGFKILRLTT